jgi:hypothetical protein
LFVSPATMFEASLKNATNRPSAEMLPSAPRPGTPSTLRLAHSVWPV